MSTRYDKRVDQLEEQMTQAGKLPPHARGPYIQWDDEDFSEIKAELLKKYGTHEGANFFTYCWGKRIPENL